MTRNTSAEPAWRAPLIIVVVILLAVAAGLGVAVFFSGSPQTGVLPSASASASGSAAEPTGSASTAPSTGTASPGASGGGPPSPVVAPPEGILPPGSVARVLIEGLRLRAEPSIDAATVTTLTSGELLGVGFSYLHANWGPVEAGEISWYPVRPLGVAELPPVPSAPFEPTDEVGWVAFGDASENYLEFVPPRCVGGDPDLAVLQSLLPWEQLACYGNRPITFDAVFGCNGCGGVFPGTFEPGWLAAPLNFNLVSVDPAARIGPMTVNFPPEGAPSPEVGSIVRLTGHFDDPAAADCAVAPGEPPQPRNAVVAQLYCRARFVVETHEVLGTYEGFPTN